MRFACLSIFLCLLAFPALACRCVAPSMDQGMVSYQEADIIIKGTVTSSSNGFSDTGPMLKIDIIDVIKGDNIPSAITANFNNVTAACGNEFTVGDDYIIALYDTRSLTLSDNNARGFGFRVMISCHQDQIRHYIENLEKEESSK